MRFRSWSVLTGMLLTGWMGSAFPQTAAAASTPEPRPYVVTVQPIVTRDDRGMNPSPMNLPVELVEQAFAPAGVSLYFLEPVFFDHTPARDGTINLDTIVRLTTENGLLDNDLRLINLFFVNTVDGKKGPLGRGMMNGNVTFVCLGEKPAENDINMVAFAIAHEIGHNLNLRHAVDDPQVLVKAPNLMGGGPFAERIGPRSLTPYQTEIVRRSPLVRPRADLLTAAEGGIQIASTSRDGFFAGLNRPALAAFTGRPADPGPPVQITADARKRFAEAVMDFTGDEQAALTWAAGQINELCLKNGLGGLARHPWRFIKTRNWLCGGFSYTRGLSIVLAEKTVQHITRRWQTAMQDGDSRQALRAIAPLLVHEQLHNLQRLFPSRFATLYQESWGFVRAEVQPEPRLAACQVGNPDAPRPEWLIPAAAGGNRAFWIRIVFETEAEVPVPGKDFVEKIYVVEKKDGAWSVVQQDGRLTTATPADVTAFNERFPVTTGIDHPNEIAAYMLGKYFRDGLPGGEQAPGQSGRGHDIYRQFIAWCKEQFR